MYSEIKQGKIMLKKCKIIFDSDTSIFLSKAAVLVLGCHCENDCASPKDTGVCRAAFQRWHYDVEANECKTFLYGGCGGNGNRYNTKKECERTCVHANGYLGCPETCPNEVRLSVLCVLCI